MSAHVLLNILNKIEKSYKMLGLPSILLIFGMSLINSLVNKPHISHT